jgi:DNA-binding MarR family transcriptional regulator
MTMTATAKLSRKQKALLQTLASAYLAQAGGARLYLGIPWTVDGDRVEQAAVSRSVRRLEARGLVCRLAVGQARTTHVKLLPQGWTVLEHAGMLPPADAATLAAVRAAVAVPRAEVQARYRAEVAALQAQLLAEFQAIGATPNPETVNT